MDGFPEIVLNQSDYGLSGLTSNVATTELAPLNVGQTTTTIASFLGVTELSTEAIASFSLTDNSQDLEAL